VSVYPHIKPPEGEGLNRKAEVNLYGFWPLDWKTGRFITCPQFHQNRSILPRFEKRLAENLIHLKAKFIEYKPEKGTLMFQVMNFTPYGLAFEGCLCIDAI
jgi:nuclear pore complex protein Nup98-Nup96